MKIDLHTHTKKVLKSEQKTRDIEDENKFKQIMEDANIQICAITNHNKFYLDQYNKFRDNKNRYLLLPGIEYDVNVSSQKDVMERRQINIIYNPDKVVEFSLKTEGITTSSDKPISIDTIIDTFDSDDTIFYFDYKKNKTSWTEGEYDKYLLKNESRKIKGVVIFDTSKITTHFVIMANKFNSLIGSDVHNWDEYVEKDSKKLVDSQIIFKSYRVFIGVLKGDDLGVVQELRQELKFDISSPNNNINLKGVPLTNGVNIIFGAKSTGKSALLDEIHSKYNSSKTIYKSEDYNKEYDKILKSREHVDDFYEPIKKLSSNLTNISNYEEIHFKDFKNFYGFIQHPPKFSIQLTTLNNIFQPYEENEEIISLSCEYKIVIEKMEKQLKINKELLKKHLILCNETSVFLKNRYLEINKKYFSYKIMDNIKKEIARLIKTKSGEISQPSTLGLIGLFNSRKKLWESIENIKKMDYYYSVEIQNFNIPDGNVWVHKQELNLFDPNNPKFIKGISFKEKKWKNTKDFFEDGLSKLFKIEKYSDPRNFIQKTKDLLNTVENLYIFENKLLNEKNPGSTPSNGEKAYIALFHSLGKDTDAFFLDEPETYLGNKMISISLIDKLKDLTMNKKKIIITTHMSSLGLNTIPFNYIYRDMEKYEDGVYKTYIGSLNGQNELKCIRNEGSKKMIDSFIKHFEGNMEQFNFRKEIYEND